MAKKLASQPNTLPPSELSKALRDVEDLMERCMLETSFFLMGETALASWEKRLPEGDTVFIGIEKRYMTPEVWGVIKSQDFWGKSLLEETEGGFSYQVGPATVRVKIVSNRYKFFQHFDKVRFDYGFYNLPNPFGKFWKARYLIK